MNGVYTFSKMGVRLGVAALALSVAVAGSLAAAGDANASSFGNVSLPGVNNVVTQQVSAPAGLEGYRTQLTNDLNAYRAQNGLRTVSVNGHLNNKAQAWAEYLARTGKMEHQQLWVEGNLGTSENIAASLSPGAATKQWRESAGHSANMLRPNAIQVGHGVSRATTGPYKGAWIVVQLYYNQY